VTAQGKSSAPDTQTNKKSGAPSRVNDRSEKKNYWRDGKAVAKRPDTKKLLRDREKGAARQKRQVTDLRPVKREKDAARPSRM
jgi:hypothetical protein